MFCVLKVPSWKFEIDAVEIHGQTVTIFIKQHVPKMEFSVQTFPDGYDLILSYANRRILVPASARHPEARGTWCADKSGDEYWFDL